MISFSLEQTVNLKDPSKIRKFEAVPLKSGDSFAHIWNVTVIDGDDDARLKGAECSCWLIRPDGDTVVIDGTIKGNVCTVNFGQGAYLVNGITKALMKLEYTDESDEERYVTIAECSLLVEDGEIGSVIADENTLIPLRELNATYASLKSDVDSAIHTFQTEGAALLEGLNANADTKKIAVNEAGGWELDGAGSVYDLSEKKVGKWIDGRSIYRKVYKIENFRGGSTSSPYLIDVGFNIGVVVSLRGMIFSGGTWNGNTLSISDDSMIFPLPYSHPSTNILCCIEIYKEPNQGNPKGIRIVGSSLLSGSGYVVVEYVR